MLFLFAVVVIYLEDGLYDYCFADIWIGVMDFEPYIKAKEANKLME